MNKRISVCIASYNGAQHIVQQIASILEQLTDEDEIVVSDDRSTDRTVELVRQIADPRIRVIEHHMNRGYTANFESALGEATGRYIFLSDQDDVWLPGKVDATLCALRSSDLVISDCFTTDTNLKVLSKSRFEDFNIKEGFFRHLIKSRYIGCCMAFRSELLRVVLPFPSRHDLVEHDTWISSVAELYFRVYLIREPLILYRRHDSNTSLGGLGKGYPLSNKVYRRGYRLLALARRRSAARRLAFEMLD